MSSWTITKNHCIMHGQQNVKFTAYGVQHCKIELCVSERFHFMLFVVSCNCWLRLCCTLYWVQVLHNTCYAHWSGWKRRDAAGARSVWLPQWLDVYSAAIWGGDFGMCKPLHGG